MILRLSSWQAGNSCMCGAYALTTRAATWLHPESVKAAITRCVTKGFIKSDEVRGPIIDTPALWVG